MSTLRRWFFTPSFKYKSPNGTNRVLHGRVTKPGHTNSVATPKTSAQDCENTKEDEEKDVDLTRSSNAEAPTEHIEESDSKMQNVAEDIKEEEEEEEKEKEDNKEEDEQDNQENLELSPIMIMPQSASPELEPFSKSDPDIKFEPGTESGPDTDFEADTESDLDMKHDSDAEPGADKTWRSEQIYLNTILNARNEFTLMPSTWRMHFRGIPLPDSLFYVKTKLKSARPRIYARTEKLEYRGALALRRLIDVHARIQDIRGNEADVKQNEELDEAEKQNIIRTLSADMARRLTRALEQALYWAKQDGEIDEYGDRLPSNVRIIDLKGSTETGFDVKIQSQLCDLAETWRAHASTGDTPVQAPVLFGFVILKHIITIVTLDASDPDATFHVPCQLHMAERNQHQWNALAILVTVCWARDVLVNYINARPDLQPHVKIESSDPDA
ncbi:hypothetical protein F5Y01DRAFT_314712 [Xylaria sp. FL0043]|nr:hypothetical protein F5Y01DRAFT_314712 [Xylaria sp. FL0043]